MPNIVRKEEIENIKSKSHYSWFEDCPMAQELKDRLRYHYGKTDNSFEFPNSLEGDLLKMTLKFLHGKLDHKAN